MNSRNMNFWGYRKPTGQTCEQMTDEMIDAGLGLIGALLSIPFALLFTPRKKAPNPSCSLCLGTGWRKMRDGSNAIIGKKKIKCVIC